MRFRNFLITLTRSPIGLIGTILAGTSGFLIVTLTLWESIGTQQHPYLGIITYMVLPVFFTIGLVLIFLGIRRQRKKIARLAETGEVGISARLIESPTLPDGASWPKPKLLLLLGAAAGLLGGLVAAIISLQREREAQRERTAAPSWVPPTRSPSSTGIGLP